MRRGRCGRIELGGPVRARHRRRRFRRRVTRGRACRSRRARRRPDAGAAGPVRGGCARPARTDRDRRGRRRRPRAYERARPLARVRHVLPPRGAGAGRPRERVAAADVHGERRRHVERPRGLPHDRRRRAGRRRVERQGVRRPGGPALHRGAPAERALPLRRVEGVRRHSRPHVRADIRPARRGHTDGEHLRRRRPQLVADRPGDRTVPALGRAPAHPQRRLATPRLPLRR